MTIRVLVVGAGAIGAFYGSRLSVVPDVKVSALCRSNYNAVKAGGFRVTSPKYPDTIWRPEYVFHSPEEAREAKVQWEYLLVSTKALPDVSDDSVLLEGLVGPNTAIVSLQNGLGVEGPYKKRFPQTVVLSGVTIASAVQPEPGIIRHNRWTRISLGPYLPHLDSKGSGPQASDATATKLNATLVRLLKEGGIQDAEAYDHYAIQFIRWHKIAINAAMNPSSVLSGGTTNQAMCKDDELNKHLLGVMHEILDVAPKVLGKPLPKDLATPERIVQSTLRNTSGSKPSMEIDWQNGRRLEIEVILGNPLRVAAEKGYEMPRLQGMYALLKKAQENRLEAAASDKAKSRI